MSIDPVRIEVYGTTREEVEASADAQARQWFGEVPFLIRDVEVRPSTVDMLNRVQVYKLTATAHDWSPREPLSNPLDPYVPERASVFGRRRRDG